MSAIWIEGEKYMICTFFGHRNCPSSICDSLKKVIADLIINENATRFYVGNNGNFDILVFHILEELKKEYPHIRYEIVLAYIPTTKSTAKLPNTILPDGIENIPKRFAILYRNKWMITHSDAVIAYVRKTYGGAYDFFEFAKKKNKLCINIADI